MFVSLKRLLCIRSPGRNLMGENPGLFKRRTSEEWQYAGILSFSIPRSPPPLPFLISSSAPSLHPVHLCFVFELGNVSPS